MTVTLARIVRRFQVVNGAGAKGLTELVGLEDVPETIHAGMVLNFADGASATVASVAWDIRPRTPGAQPVKLHVRTNTEPGESLRAAQESGQWGR
jgi:hypothetical protein